jgi:hypothetical protein
MEELDAIIRYWNTLDDPVVIMERALYGHPDSVTWWEHTCNKDVKEVGFKNMGPDWPSVFFHDGLRLMLPIYVDDFKLAGRTENLSRGWDVLRTHLEIGPESDTGMYLGCNIFKHEIKLMHGVVARAVVYDMEFFLEQCLARYVVAAGGDVKL